MNELPKSFNDIKLPLLGKVVRWLIPILLIWGAIKGFNYIAPTLKDAMDNFWYLVVRVVPATLLVALVALNWTALNLWWLGACKKLSSWIIAMDPISVMKGYLITLKKKAKNLSKTLLFLNGKKVELERIIDQKQADYKQYTKIALAAKQQNEVSTANLNAEKALACKNSIEIYTPIYNRYVANTKFLEELEENWKNSIDSLEFTIQNKTEEYETIKSMVGGLKSIEDMTSSGSPEAQAFAESMKALEASVSQNIAFIDDFEKKAQPILTNMKVQKQADTNDAMKLLEELTKDNKLQLPNYQTFTPTLNVQDVDYEMVESKYNIK